MTSGRRLGRLAAKEGLIFPFFQMQLNCSPAMGHLCSGTALATSLKLNNSRGRGWLMCYLCGKQRSLPKQMRLSLKALMPSDKFVLYSTIQCTWDISIGTVLMPTRYSASLQHGLQKLQYGSWFFFSPSSCISIGFWSLFCWIGWLEFYLQLCYVLTA